MTAQNGSSVRPDPVTLEIIRNLLIAILDEGEINLSRTAFSPIIYEVKDYCVGLLDVHANTIAQSRGGIPTFMADLGEPVKDGIRIYGEQGFAPGDIVLINAAVVCGQHLNNMVLYMPVHWEGKVVGFAAVRAHWTDVGGSVPGSMATDTKDIFQEGLQLRTVKIHKAGVVDEELMRVISHNIRFPELSLGDMAAQIGACKLIVKRWQEMIAKYGWPMMQACIEAIWDQSEAFVRRQIAALPDGRYEAEAFMDDDGIDFSKTLPVKVGVTIAGDSLEIDFSEVCKQTQGPMNSGRSGGLAAARVAFKSAILPSLPPNEGAFRPLSVKLPEGTVLSATGNAAMGMWNLALKTVIDVIYRALSHAAPDRVPAGHHGSQGMYLFYGTDPVTGKRFSALDTALGGWGAAPAADGFSPLKTMTHGDTRNVPLEVEETAYPLSIERWAWRTDSGGAGEFRGGLGLSKIYRVHQDVEVILAFERSKCPPWGLFGGKEAAVGYVLVRQPGETEPTRHQKVTGLKLKAGATVEMLSGGGGGRGNPFRRDVALVLEDVRQNYVSAEAARRDYGVMIDPATLEVDAAATTALRSEVQS